MAVAIARPEADVGGCGKGCGAWKGPALFTAQVYRFLLQPGLAQFQRKCI